jgi:hypothetical protein
MTITVANTSNTSTFQYWLDRTNEIAHALTNYVVTTNSNTATGNAAISGTFTANTISITNGITANSLVINTSVTTNTLIVNTTITSGNLTVNSAVTISNSTANITILVPNTSVSSNGQYFLNANGSWTTVPTSAVSTGSVTTSGLSDATVDSFSVSTYSAVEYLIQIKDNNANNFQSTKLIVCHSVGAAFATEYATLVSNTSLGTFYASISSGNVAILFSPTSSNTTIKFARIIV